MSRERLSAVVITLNESAAIEACLRSLAFADEILVIDSGSTDETVAMAQAQGARVIHQEWLGYGAQKQLGVERAQHDWILSIDADERISEALQARIEHTLRQPTAQAYAMARCNRFMGRWLRHGEGYPDYSLRLFHRTHARWSEDAVHEKVVTQGTVARIDGDLLHESEEGIEDYLVKQNHYTCLQARALFERGKRVGVMKLLFSPLLRFIKFYVFRLGFLDGLPGLVHISIGCMNSYMKYAKLIEYQRKAS